MTVGFKLWWTQNSRPCLSCELLFCYTARESAVAHTVCGAVGWAGLKLCPSPWLSWMWGSWALHSVQAQDPLAFIPQTLTSLGRPAGVFCVHKASNTAFENSHRFTLINYI